MRRQTERNEGRLILEITVINHQESLASLASQSFSVPGPQLAAEALP